MNNAPIGMFDSGVGGLSVLREVRQLLPNEDIVYYADTGYCPYGPRPHHEIVERAVTITDFLLNHGAKLIVVACNTATVHAVQYLREHYALSFVGMEPGIKPAALHTRSGVIGVMATQAAVASDRIHSLITRFASHVRVIIQPCPGLVEQVEAGDLTSNTTRTLIEDYTRPMLDAGADTITLGCTHYPFLRPLIQTVVGDNVTILDTGFAVAQQTKRLLTAEELLANRQERGTVTWHTSGDPIQFAHIRDVLGFGD